MIWTALFWKATAERAIRTFAGAFLASGVVSAGVDGLTEIDWLRAISVAGLAAVVSVAMALATLPLSDGPGFTEVPKPKAPAHD